LIPSFIAGIARMAFVMVLIFNTTAAVIYQFATALPAYGAGKVLSGHSGGVSIAELAAGVGLVAVIGWRLIRRRRAGIDPSRPSPDRDA
jgi:membrane protein DedA with SNARE-associated domain